MTHLRQVLRLVSLQQTCSSRTTPASLCSGWLLRSFSSSSSAYSDQATPLAEHNSDFAERIWTEYNVHKGGAAVKIRPFKPTWKEVGRGVVAVDKPGVLFFQFGTTIPGGKSNAGERKYDWNSGHYFAFTAHELGLLFTSNDSIVLLHDPYKMGTREGEIMKRLQIAKKPETGSWLLTLGVTVKKTGQKTNYVVPLSNAEYKVIQLLAAFSLPRILGIDMDLRQ